MQPSRACRRTRFTTRPWLAWVHILLLLALWAVALASPRAVTAAVGLALMVSAGAHSVRRRREASAGDGP